MIGPRPDRIRAFFTDAHAAAALLAAVTAGAVAVAVGGCGSPAGATVGGGPAASRPLSASEGIRPQAAPSVAQASADVVDLRLAAVTTRFAAAMARIEAAAKPGDALARERLRRSGIFAAVVPWREASAAFDGLGPVTSRNERRLVTPTAWSALPPGPPHERLVARTYLGPLPLEAGVARMLVRVWPVPTLDAEAGSGVTGRLRVQMVPQHLPRGPGLAAEPAPLVDPGGPAADGPDDVTLAQGLVLNDLGFAAEAGPDDVLILALAPPSGGWQTLIEATNGSIGSGAASTARDERALRLEAPSLPDAPVGPPLPGRDDLGYVVSPEPLPGGVVDDANGSRSAAAAEPKGPMPPPLPLLGELIFGPAESPGPIGYRRAALGERRRVLILRPRLPETFTLLGTPPRERAGPAGGGGAG